MMANISRGELHDELWKLFDIGGTVCSDPITQPVSDLTDIPPPDQIPRKGIVPDDVIDVPELDDALLATHSAVESAKFAMPAYNRTIEVNREVTNKEINVIEQHGGARHLQPNESGLLHPGRCYLTQWFGGIQVVLSLSLGLKEEYITKSVITLNHVRGEVGCVSG